MGDVYKKVYVDVNVKCKKDGSMVPLSVLWSDGSQYDIDRVINVCRAASLKAGGSGVRYTCRIKGRETNIFYEEDRWFVEAKDEYTPNM